jgi:hypothetical protein
MSITYPLSLPTVTGFKSLIITQDANVALTESPWSYNQQIQQNQGQRWMFDAVLPVMTRASAMVWQAFFLSLNGRQGTFTMGDPANTATQGIGTGTPLVNGASQIGQTINTDGWTPSQTGILKAGDWVQFGSGLTARLYKQLVDVNSDGSGNAALTLWPNVSIGNSPADNAPITVANTVGLFRLMDVVPFSVDSAMLYSHQFKAQSIA